MNESEGHVDPPQKGAGEAEEAEDLDADRPADAPVEPPSVQPRTSPYDCSLPWPWSTDGRF